MSKFRKKRKGELPEISTASLPDIVFMLLFFFMVATVMRNDTLMVENRLPSSDQEEKLEKRNLTMDIYVGKPSSRYKKFGEVERIQLNDKFAKIEDIKPFILSEIASKSENLRPLLVTSLRVDKDVKMGLVGAIKEELREVNALKVNYTTKQGEVISSFE